MVRAFGTITIGNLLIHPLRACRNEPYRRESTSQGWNQQATNRKRSFDMSSAAPPKAPRSDQHEKRFDPPSYPKGMGNEKGRAGLCSNLFIRSTRSLITDPGRDDHLRTNPWSVLTMFSLYRKFSGSQSIRARSYCICPIWPQESVFSPFRGGSEWNAHE